MKLEDFEVLSEASHGNSDKRQIHRFIEGMTMLAGKHDDAYSLQAEHDELFCGGPSPEDPKWSDDELKAMVECGWRWDDSVESWAIFT